MARNVLGADAIEIEIERAAAASFMHHIVSLHTILLSSPRLIGSASRFIFLTFFSYYIYLTLHVCCQARALFLCSLLRVPLFEQVAPE